ncbi:MAG: zf-HC2 domain-containing protein [Gemmatimonadaceae bacterium]
MNDCLNADVRDLLPDLLNDRLPAAERQLVESHVAHCADCGAELMLLKDVRAATTRTPRVDVATIVAAVPAYRAPARRSWVGWRVAAAITVVAAGASSLLVARAGTRVPERAPVIATIAAPVPGTPAARVPVATRDLPPATPRATDSVREAAPGARQDAVPVSERELAMAGGALNDLNDRELATLLKDIETMDALPSVDVESANVSPLSPKRGTP